LLLPVAAEANEANEWQSGCLWPQQLMAEEQQSSVLQIITKLLISVTAIAGISSSIAF